MTSDTRITALTALFVLLLAHAGTVRAETPRASFDVDLAAGMEYDSSVGIADIDANTGEPDNARRLEAGISARYRSTDWLSLRMAADYSDLAYREFEEFDLGLGHLLGELAFSTTIADAALTVEHYDGRLAGERYLALTQYTPSVSKLLGKRLFVRAAYTVATKNYDALPSRNADNRSLRGDVYLLLDGMQHYVALAAQRADEDAVSAELDYGSTMVTATYGRRFGFAERPLGIKAQVSRTVRGYDNATESIGGQRRDERLRLGLVATLALSDLFEMEARLEHLRTVSNLPAAELDKNRVGVTLRVSF